MARHLHFFCCNLFEFRQLELWMWLWKLNASATLPVSLDSYREYNYNLHCYQQALKTVQAQIRSGSCQKPKANITAPCRNIGLKQCTFLFLLWTSFTPKCDACMGICAVMESNGLRNWSRCNAPMNIHYLAHAVLLLNTEPYSKCFSCISKKSWSCNQNLLCHAYIPAEE